MSLRYFTVQSLLQPYIRSFSIIEEPAMVFNKRRILPNSFPALMINLGAPFVLETDNGRQELPRTFFIRAQTKPLKIQATGACQTIVLNLSAWGARFLVDEQTDLSTTEIVALGANWQDLNRLLDETLCQRGEHEALATFAQFISDLDNRTRIDAAAVRTATELLYKTNGQLNVHELAAQCYLSSSQLERQFKYFTGLSPKMTARLIRFDATCSGLLNDSSPHLTDLAHKFGYADQAHFIHEFKSFATITPRAAKVYVQQLAADAEFLQFS